MNYWAINENGSFGTMVDKVQCDFHARIPRSNNKNMLIFEILPRTKPSGMNELPRKATEALKLRHKRVSGFTSGHHQKPPTVLLELTGVPVEGHDPPVVAALVVLGQLHGSSVQRRDSEVGDVVVQVLQELLLGNVGRKRCWEGFVGKLAVLFPEVEVEALV